MGHGTQSVRSTGRRHHREPKHTRASRGRRRHRHRLGPRPRSIPESGRHRSGPWVATITANVERRHVTTNRNVPVRIVDSNRYGLVGHWAFDEGAGANAANSASTGSLYDANLVAGSALTSAESKFGGGSLHLPTGSSNARAEVKNGEISLNASYTISAWFKNLYPNNRWRTLTRGKNFDNHIILRAGNAQPRFIRQWEG